MAPAPIPPPDPADRTGAAGPPASAGWQRALRLAIYVVGFGFAALLGAAAWLDEPRAHLWAGTALALLVALVLLAVYGRTFERFVGLRYLHQLDTRAAVVVPLAGALALCAASAFVFARAHGVNRGLETVAVIVLLDAALAVLVSGLLVFFSVFTAVSTIGVTLGVASLVVVMAVTSGFEREFMSKILGLNAHIIVLPYGAGDVDAPEIVQAEKRLRGAPGVVRMARFVFSAGEIMVGKVGANLKGVDLVQGADDLRAALVDGRVEDLGRPASCPLPAALREAGGPQSEPAARIVLGAELAHRLHLGVGGCVPVMVPFPPGRVTEAPPQIRFRVVGIFRMGFNEYDTRLAYTSLEDARKVAVARDLVAGVELRYADPMRALGAMADIRERLQTGRSGLSGYKVIDWKDLNHNIFQALFLQKLVISLFLVLIIVVAAFNIIASLTMIVMSKVREIAILKSMGAPSSAVGRIFMVGGVSVGGVGTALGIGYGALVCVLAQSYGYPLDPRVYLIGRLPVEVNPDELVAVAAATLCICLLATVYPSVRAARQAAVDGLRYE